jgi:short subunit dehydrogenase-like uncharacterized protein
VAGDRDVDIALLGATGFVGRLVAEYLAGHAPADLRIALAGRDEGRLTATRHALGPRAADWPLLLADTGDARSLAALATSARVVATTAGPYAGRGLALVEACARAGTDYADLTGEVLFVRDSIDTAHEVAAGTRARIVHACGFDSIPSDLGVLLLHEAAVADGAGGLTDTTFVLTGVKGGVSGGTIASGLGQLAEVRADRSRARVVADPYALSPDRAAEPDRHGHRCGPDTGGPAYDQASGRWVAPFVMATFNTRIVRRSNALLGHGYGPDFCYRELMATGRGRLGAVRAIGLTAGLGLAAGATRLRPARELASRLLPGSGEGPDQRTRDTGFFRVELRTRTADGSTYLAEVAAHGDPGYAATAVMFGETALCLALDRDRTPDRAGVLTPATGLGRPLVDRLQAAGFTFGTRRVP